MRSSPPTSLSVEANLTLRSRHGFVALILATLQEPIRCPIDQPVVETLRFNKFDDIQYYGSILLSYHCLLLPSSNHFL